MCFFTFIKIIHLSLSIYFIYRLHPMTFEKSTFNNLDMKKKKLTEKQRGHLKLAYEAQQIAKPYLKQGRHSLIEIYLNYVVKEIPVCINTFRKMMKEDVSDYPQIAEKYQQKAKEQYFALLKNQSRKRIRSSKSLTKKGIPFEKPQKSGESLLRDAEKPE